MEPEYTMVTPEASTYRDINLDSPLPVITESSVAAYLRILDAKVAKIAKDLYNERYLTYCRYTPGLAGTTLFVRAKCQAQMKSGVSYIVDVELDNDGMVCTVQCECAAGMGPVAHCKYVCTVLYELTVYVTEGGLKAIKTGTQTLQQFHAVKRVHGGSPVKASNLKQPFGNQMVYDQFNVGMCRAINTCSPMFGKQAQELVRGPSHTCWSQEMLGL